ncbi:MAG: tol-pal system-associated acyl-CoA thioesterase [Pontibacterium sp.]
MDFEFSTRVYIEDTDMGGIVYYVNYLKFFERARTELLRHLGFNQHELQQAGILFVVHRVECDYLRSARLDDELLIRVGVTKQTATTLLFRQVITKRGQSEVLCQAEVKVVCVNGPLMKPTRIPKTIAQEFNRYLSAEKASGSSVKR